MTPNIQRPLNTAISRRAEENKLRAENEAIRIRETKAAAAVFEPSLGRDLPAGKGPPNEHKIKNEEDETHA